MRNVDRWHPSKFRPRPDGQWEPNPAYILPQSRFLSQLLVGPYVSTIRAQARGRLLDAGCGDVPFFAVYGDRVTEVTCVDWPASSHGHQHVDAWVDLNRALPFHTGRFDTVLLADVLEHVAEPDVLLGELARVLAPGGRLIVMVPFMYWIHEAPHDYFRYTEHGLRHLSASAGLVVDELAAYGGYPDVLIDLLCKGLVRGHLLGGLAARLGCAGEAAPFRFLRERMGRAFPLGYILVACKAT